MLNAYRRHTATCRNKRALAPKVLKKCDCPVWVIGTDPKGTFQRLSLNTCDLLTASRRIRKLEDGEPLNLAPVADLTISEAWNRYISILQSQRDIKASTLHRNHDIVKNALLLSAGKRTMNALDETFLDDLVATWKTLSAGTRNGRVQILQDFFTVCESRKWIARDPSKLLKRPKRTVSKCTLPFDLEKEDPRITAAIPYWNDGTRQRFSAWAKNPITAAALVYVLRFTGLRISDAIMFEPRSLVKRVIDGRKVYCYFLPRMEKTDEPLFIVIRPEVAEYIINAPRLTEEFAFYDPEGTENNDDRHKSMWCGRIQQNVLAFLESVSGVPNIHPHRFRDTFAVDLLNHDVDIRAVSRLLGHRNVATTMRFYEHWIPGDQANAARAMLKTWDSGNVIAFPAKAKVS